MLTILQTLKIYPTDYMVGPSYIAYTHYRIGEFIQGLSRRLEEEDFLDFMNALKGKLSDILGKSTFSTLDMVYHYRMARDLYRKSEQLHQAGSEYKKAIQSMIYLEDDFSDNAYHFGAALDRYKLINEGFSRRIDKCEKFLIKQSNLEIAHKN
jgi:hypothetical protein